MSVRLPTGLRARRRLCGGGIVAVLATTLLACGTRHDPTAVGNPDAGGAAVTMSAAAVGGEAVSTGGRCDPSTRVGTFEIVLADGYTVVQGQVAGAVTPSRVPVVTATEGACSLLQSPTYVCDPRCGSGFTCADGGVCVALPENVGVGTVTVDGLKTEVSMTANSPVYFYTARGDLEHPAFDAGAAITLAAEGLEGDAFTLGATGIEALAALVESVRVERGQAVALAWGAPSAPGDWELEITLNLANHGGTPAWITCTTEDDGSFDIPADLVSRLLDLGYSGFPSVALTRQSVDAEETERGCIDLLVRSTVEVEVELPGLVSCNLDADCPTGQTCRSDLTCK